MHRWILVGLLTACATAEVSDDADNDGFSVPADCDDSDPDINPGAAEVWYDGIDQNCDGLNDFDQDRDGDESRADGSGEDCNDLNAAVSHCLYGLPGCSFEEIWEGHGYVFCEHRRSWSDAASYCEDAGMTLVIVDGSQENTHLTQRTVENDVDAGWFIGLSDQTNEGDWRWVDGTSPAFTNWRAGEPSNSGGEDCAVIRNAGDTTWNDVQCAAEGQPFICEDTDPGW